MYRKSLFYSIFLSIITFFTIPILPSKYIICDLGGVLINHSRLGCIQALGIERSFWYWWSGGSLANLSHKFFHFLEELQPCGPQTPTLYNAQGHWLPGLMSEWMCGANSIALLEHIHTTLRETNFIYDHPELSHMISEQEYQLFYPLAEMIFNPRTLAQNQRLVRSGVSFVKECKRAGHRLYILSNWNGQSFDVLKNRPNFAPFFDLFDDMVISGHVKCAKPDPQIYKIMFQTIQKEHPQARPSDCIFIDDQIENVRAAQNYGFQAFWCRNGNFGPIRTHLKRLRWL